MKLKIAAATAASLFALGVATTASADIVLLTGNVGGTGIHSCGGQDQITTAGGSACATVGVGGEQLQELSSTAQLQLNGQGEATIDGYDPNNSPSFDGPVPDLFVDFLSGYSIVGFNIELLTNPTVMDLVVKSTTGGTFNFLDVNLTGNGENKYYLLASGPDLIDSLQFNFDPAVDDLKQFRLTVGTAGGIPEPATWGMMIMGFGGMGALMRRRRMQAIRV